MSVNASNVQITSKERTLTELPRILIVGKVDPHHSISTFNSLPQDSTNNNAKTQTRIDLKGQSMRSQIAHKT